MKSKKKHMLKISAVYLIGNPEICKDPLAVAKMIRPFYAILRNYFLFVGTLPPSAGVR